MFLTPQLESQSAAVASEFILELYNLVLGACVLAFTLALLAGGGLRVDLVGYHLLAKLAGLVPPPLVDLLLAHQQVGFVLSLDFLDGLSGPHIVLVELCLQNVDLQVRLPPATSDFLLLALVIPLADKLRTLLTLLLPSQVKVRIFLPRGRG